MAQEPYLMSAEELEEAVDRFLVACRQIGDTLVECSPMDGLCLKTVMAGVQDLKKCLLPRVLKKMRSGVGGKRSWSRS